MFAKLWDRMEPTFSRLRDQIQDSPIVIELKSRYAELDPKAQQIVSIAIFGVLALVILLLPISLAVSVSSKKSAINAAQDSIYFLRKSKAELDFLTKQINLTGNRSRKVIDPNSSLEEIAAKSAAQAAIPDTSIEIKNNEGGARGLSVALNRVSLIQLMGVMYSIESSGAPVSISGMDIDLRNDREGWMWASLNIKKEASTDEDRKKKSFSR